MAKQPGQMIYQVHLSPGHEQEKPAPLMLVLHGDGLGGDIKYQSWFWKPQVMLERGMVVVYVQSSQMKSPGCFGWLKDFTIAKKDIKECFDQVLANYSIELDRIYMGGFSGGAIMSTETALANDLPVKGWIGLCPEIKPVSFSRENLELAKKRGLRAVFLEGELKAWLDDEKEMLRLFEEVKFPYRSVINQGIEHAFPADFDQKLNQALDFILTA